jgi:hypothetical protein
MSLHKTFKPIPRAICFSFSLSNLSCPLSSTGYTLIVSSPSSSLFCLTRLPLPSTTLPIVAREPGDCFQMDIMVYNRFQYDNYKYILTCIDVYSRYAQAIPLKSKHLNVDQELWNTRELQQ